MVRHRILSMLALPAALSLGACSSKDSPDTVRVASPAGPRLALRAVETAEWKDVGAEITTTDRADARARIPGVLESLSVRKGDMVRKGQVIGRIVDTRLAYEGSAYGAQAAAAQAQAVQAQADLARIRYLYDNGVYAKARLDQAQAAATAARAQVGAARAQQSAVGAVAGQGAVVAPADGRVLTADIPAGSAVTPGMSIAGITAGPLVLRFELPESLAGKVHVGSRVLADGVSGAVTKLYPSVQAGQITADVAAPGLDGSLIGRRVSARVAIGTRQALIVPRTFVTTRYGIDYVTVVAKDGQLSTVPVQIASTVEPGRIEILSGVGEGDMLVAGTAPR
ncbi:efflux RND transporter periplasmic adaptor subunit [Sphingomonas oligophenolica]|uniref:Efflux RND transporter periplasmic adaptor subunit n=1 Tax=Sphingomonas oligophenolica TaxID=301154 RepID=A0ABU9YBW8_9SPHN